MLLVRRLACKMMADSGEDFEWLRENDCHFDPW